MTLPTAVSSPLIAAALALVTAPPAATQVDSAPLQSRTERRIERVHYQEAGDTLWARGTDYKASFGPDAVRFIPFLGSEAPRNFPVEFTLGRVSLGAEALEFAESPGVQREGDRVELDRGSLVEIYDLAPGSVEQSFAFDIDHIAEELVLAIDWKSELGAVAIEDGIGFTGEFGGVHYTHALAIDGRGRSLPLPIEWDAGQITLRVPAEFMATAVSPVVVDPIITTFGVGAGSQASMVDSDVAHNGNFDRFVFVNQESFSQNDQDLSIAAYSGTTGAFIGNSYADITAVNYVQPSIANNNVSGLLMVVSLKANGSPFVGDEVIMHLVNGSSLGATNAIVVDAAVGGAFAYTNRVPDVGGYSGITPQSPGGGGFCVAYVQEGTQIQRFQVVMRYFSPGGGNGTVNVLLNGINTSRRDVAVSKAAGDSTHDEWRVVWTEPQQSPTPAGIYGARVSGNGTVIQGRTNVFALPNTAYVVESLDVSEGLAGVPGVATGAPLSCLLFTTRIGTDRDLWTIPLEGNHVGQPSRLDDAEHMAVPELTAAIGTTDNDFIVSTYDKPALPTRASYSVVNYTTEGRFAVRDRREVLFSSNLLGTIPAPGVASRYSGGFYSSDIVAAVALRVRPGSTRLDAEAVLLTAPTEPAIAAQFCFGNPNSTGQRGLLTVLGSADTTTPKTLRASGLPANQFGIFIVSPGGTTEFSPATSSGVLCIAGAPLGRMVLPGQIVSSGSDGQMTLPLDPSAIPTPTAFVAATPGSTWSFQGWHRDGTGSSNFTNAVSLQFQ